MCSTSCPLGVTLMCDASVPGTLTSLLRVLDRKHRLWSRSQDAAQRAALRAPVVTLSHY